MTKHAAGPWFTEEQNRQGTTFRIRCEIGRPNGGAGMKIADNVSDSNARLIAAAPEMFEALKVFEQCFGRLIEEDEHIGGADAVDWICEMWPQVKAALAKAEGRDNG